MLENYDWPGNIRELENAVVRAAALCDEIIRPEDLPERVRNFSKITNNQSALEVPSNDGEGANDTLLTLSEMERQHIVHVLARVGGNKQAAARALDIDRTTLKRKIQRYRI